MIDLLAQPGRLFAMAEAYLELARAGDPTPASWPSWTPESNAWTGPPPPPPPTPSEPDWRPS